MLRENITFRAMAIALICLSCASRDQAGHMAAKRLVPVTEEAQKKVVSSVVGPVWQWTETLYNDGKKIVPSGSKDYTLQLLEDGKLNVRADCNLKGGTYSMQERLLSIEITHSTMAACPDGSLEDRFVRDLTAGASYFLKDDDLYIDLKFDSGTMRFLKQKEKQL